MATNTNMYDTFGTSMYSTGISQVEYTDLSHSTSRPNSNMSVLSPYNRPYVQFQNAFNNNMLNPHQNDPSILPRAYYTIQTAYGPPPGKTQTNRSCTGILEHRT